jgi:hypothetical protein
MWAVRMMPLTLAGMLEKNGFTVYFSIYQKNVPWWYLKPCRDEYMALLSTLVVECSVDVARPLAFEDVWV